MATIVIAGNNDFRNSVVGALREICPCHTYRVQADGTVQVTGGGTGFFACLCYCKHRAGCNLINDLSGHANTTRITRTAGGNSYNRGLNRVRWNPTRRRGGRNAHGDRDRPPSVGLAHELIHAHHDNQGTMGAPGPAEEYPTVRGENQIRRELCEPRRTHYGNTRVPNETQENIDASDRRGCKCNSPFMRFLAFLRCLLCCIKLFFRRLCRRLRRLLRPDRMITAPENANTGFLALADAAGDTAAAGAARFALDARLRAQDFGFVAERLTEIDGAKAAALLELIDVDGSAYGFILLLEADSGSLFASNLDWVEGDVSVSEPGPVVTVDSPDIAIGELAQSLPFEPGIGGADGVYDGSVVLLTVNDGRSLRRAALHGYSYPFLDDEPERPESEADQPRYAAAVSVFEAWSQLRGGKGRGT